MQRPDKRVHVIAHRFWRSLACSSRARFKHRSHGENKCDSGHVNLSPCHPLREIPCGVPWLCRASRRRITNFSTIDSISNRKSPLSGRISNRTAAEVCFGSVPVRMLTHHRAGMLDMQTGSGHTLHRTTTVVGHRGIPMTILQKIFHIDSLHLFPSFRFYFLLSFVSFLSSPLLFVRSSLSRQFSRCCYLP